VDKLTVAEWAKRLLDDDFFKKVMSDLKNQQISAILNTNRDDVDERENAYLVVKTLELIEGHLQGLAAEKQIRDKKWKIL
jgi:RNA binding exosome subunit